MFGLDGLTTGTNDDIGFNANSRFVAIEKFGSNDNGVMRLRGKGVCAVSGTSFAFSRDGLSAVPGADTIDI